ncbi:MAG: membrane protein insertion efficiency factor YidD [Syntrophobacterales bacterium CG_4_8_14_3_um_filter_49_14]|nr:MAG: membrane protein insertion efficiency factor YidD [Syntrophobacterales bacterium CG23_combo_of_CG06-09_8_20_14_all_48_27]PJA48848.1 MAG: membrane protein insertion efficiency factor YidD [Syntrophobacterales bacterium CG_4_9_14_3_um_filter_49_8]PJC74725.1 MAG: membrane protein insertion efficiency factor YidD [Syntrophobacterales bacterium CG_4_8_14_3_um_filter_49_14]
MQDSIFIRILGEILVILVRFYRICISPFFSPCCRFYPSCSEYAMEAIKRHGPFKGLLLSLGRLLRCHPLHPGGYDPV